MDPCEFRRQVADRLARTPAKVGQVPLRAAQLGAATPGKTPYEIVHEEPLVRLRRYEPRVPDGDERAVPVVIAYPFINDPSILDFAPDRSVVRGYLEDGFPVYVLEWTDASPLDRSLGVGDYVDRFLYNCVDVAREETGAEAVHLQGYSVSAPLVAGYAALHPDTVRTLVLQGPPLAFDAGAEADVELFRLLAAHHDRESLAETLEAVPTELLEAGLLLRKPVELTVTYPLRLWDRLEDEAFVDETGRKLAWLVGGPTIPGTLYREFLEDLVLEDRLIEDEWRLNGRAVDLERIDVPVALVLGREDAFVPRAASLPFLEAIPSDETTVIELPVGHVGLSTSAEAHEGGWPQVREWLAARS